MVADQLRLRGGLVRCGACRAVFSGNEHLRTVTSLKEDRADTQDEQPDLAPPGASVFRKPERRSASQPIDDDADGRGAADWSAEDQTIDDAFLKRRFIAATDSALSIGPTSAGESAPDAPFGRTAMPPDAARLEAADLAAPDTRSMIGEERRSRSGEAQVDGSDREDEALGESGESGEAPDLAATSLHRRADLRERDAQDELERAIIDDEVAIDYFSSDRVSRGFLGQNARLKTGLAAGLIALLVLQAIVGYRDWLAYRFPALSAIVAALSTPFGLTPRPPRALESVSIASFELESTAHSELLTISAILRNDALHPVRPPSLMLSLLDSERQIVSRKAIEPTDYLGGSTPEPALRARSERPIRVAIDVQGNTPAGYSAELFYR